jgi:hypothetical protein
MNTVTTVTERPTISQEDWEWLWAPHDEGTYQQVMDWVNAEDIVLDIGAGDLRLARRLTEKARHVYAIEVNRALDAMVTQPLPKDNLTVIWNDAYRVPFPAGITAAVLLLRHCQGFLPLVKKLRNVGCRRLITNARWGVAVELIDLLAPPTLHANVDLGWYACRCGATGFVEGPPVKLTPQIESTVHEVIDCPACI